MSVSFKANASDPTETKTRRKSFIQSFHRRLRDFRGENRDWLESHSYPVNESRLLSRYRRWFTQTADSTVLEQTRERRVDRGRHWTGQYVRSAYEKGIRLARRHLAQAEYPEDAIARATVFEDAEHESNRRLLYQQAYAEVESIVGRLETDATRTFSTGLQNEQSFYELADKINSDIRGSGENRAKAFANTFVVRAVNEALLSSYEQAGVEEVGVQIESMEEVPQTNYMRVNAAGEVFFQTAMDSRVCRECRALQGRILQISEIKRNPAEFKPPIHPNCRCKLLPLPMDIKTTGETIDVPDSFSES